MLNIAPDDVHRFPAPRLHNREQPNTVGHEILRGPDPHRVAGEALNDMGIEPGGVSSAFDDTIDRVGMQGVRAYAVARDFAEQPILLDRSSIEPRAEDFDGRRREIAVAAVAEGVVLGPPDEDRHRAVFKRGKIFQTKRHQFSAPAERVVADRNEGMVAKTEKAVGAGPKKPVTQVSCQPVGLLLSPRFRSERTAHCD